MRSGGIVARRRKSDFEKDGSYRALDEDAEINAELAFCSVIDFIQNEPHLINNINLDKVHVRLKSDLSRISHKYWMDWDHDERYKLVHIKKEAKRLISPLKKTMSKLEELTEFAQSGLNVKAKEFLPTEFMHLTDVYATACATNEAVLRACHAYRSEKLKKEAATKYRNACVELVKTWEALVERPFSQTLQMDRAIPRIKFCPPWTVFHDVDAQFVFVALYEIGRRWVRPAQVEGGLRAVLRK